MIKPELLEDAKKCAKILCSYNSGFFHNTHWRIHCGEIKAENILGMRADFNPYKSTHDFAMLTKAVFEHELLINGAYEIRINNFGYSLTLNAYYKIHDVKNLTDFLIRALPVLEGK